jgi:hypothetical protein
MTTRPGFHLFDRVYPAALRDSERSAIASRRAHAGLPPDAPDVGVALSGGGIRSATFCLGLFQALARHRLIRRIDYLSTVSGGGYFGSFLGAGYARGDASAALVESSLADSHSWLVKWLRENGRFLSPNGAGDNWLSAAVAVRNWIALHVVLLSFIFLVFGVSALIRVDLATMATTSDFWIKLELALWNHPTGGLWWSPWVLLTLIPFLVIMVPTGVGYWFTQSAPLMEAIRRACGILDRKMRDMPTAQFVGHAQNLLTRGFMVGLIPTVVLLGFALIESIGQTLYLRWSTAGFGFPALWATLTGAGAGAFGLGVKIAVYVERLLGVRKFRIPFNLIALGLALVWFSLIVIGLSVLASGFAWRWGQVWNGMEFQPMSGGWSLMILVAICFVTSWICSRSFSFVNLSSMQQVYTARLSRAYLGATNPRRREHQNHSMTDLIPGDDLSFDHYLPHRHGGPLHLINVTVNETLSGKTQIERRDRKGMVMSIGPCGLSVGKHAHALWATESLTLSPFARLQALWERRQRAVSSISANLRPDRFDALAPADPTTLRHIETLTLGRWVAISGAAFTTGTGASTHLGLSLLLGLANVRLGYWWDSGAPRCDVHPAATRPTFIEVASRVLTCVLPVQTCLMNEFFARFHGPARRHWYLSDGGHFENTACYELIRRRVPFIICSDAGQDADYRFDDFANLVRKVRTDFGAEIQVVRRGRDPAADDPDERFPLPKLEQLVHPALLKVIGSLEDFVALSQGDAEDGSKTSPGPYARCHAFLARIHYLDDDTFGWMLVVKPSLMGDEAADVVQYQRTHPLFPQEPTSDQYFDEAQWESYRKLGEHIGAELFTPPVTPAPAGAGTWSPSEWCAPRPPVAAPQSPEVIGAATVVSAQPGAFA